MKHWLAIVVVALMSFGVAACGDDGDSDPSASQEASSDDGGGGNSGEASGLDTSKIEASLESSLGGSSSSSLDTGPQVTKVSCPDEVDAKANTTFDCEATGEAGLAGQVTVTLTNAAGTEFEYKGKLQAEGFTSEVSGSSTAS